MLNVFLKMCRQLFLFVCVFICFQAATLNPERKCTILPAASERILWTRLMTTTRYVKPIETSQNTGIHHRKLNQRISTVYDIENSGPHQVCLDLYPFSHTDAFSGNNARN